MIIDQNGSPSNASDTSFIPADQTLPEITLKAVILAVFLVIILAAANAYLGLKVGTTVSASIPAAVISMGILRLFKKSNILENNIVQTAASSGEALVAGIAYILPALLIIHFWQNFNYFETVSIAAIGGIFGVLFSVPLRRVLLAQKTLRFPEGTAIGQVLKASADGSAGLSYLLKGGIIGGIISFLQAGFQLVSDSWQVWIKASDNYIYGFGLGFDPALIAAGYIVGINVALSTLLGVILGWAIGVPALSHIFGVPQVGSASDAAISIWHSHIRYIGVGTMLIGGFWTLCTLIKPIIQGLKSSFASVKAMREDNTPPVPRTELDIPINYIGWVALFLIFPLIFLLFHFASNPMLGIGLGMKITVVTFGVLFIIFAGFIFSALNGYFAGLVGSTNSPGSGLVLSALLLASLFILTVFQFQVHFDTSPSQTLAAAALAIIITSIMSAASVITNETIQDLKAGQIVGATPWKQQVMLILGTIIAAFVIPLVLKLLFNAYGIGGVFPHPGMDPTQMLAAPQAGLMAALAQGVFAHDLPWNMIGTGAVIAVVCICIDTFLKTKNTRLPVLAVGLGIYLPLDASTPMIIGGIASYLIERRLTKRYSQPTQEDKTAATQGRQRGLVLACGLVAGAALMGVILAIPFAIAQSTDVLKLVPDSFTPIANALGIAVGIGLPLWISYIVCKKVKTA